MNRMNPTAVLVSSATSSQLNSADSANDAKRAGRVSLMRRALVALVMLLTVVGAVTATAPKASAAPYGALATVCFTQNGGGAFTGTVAAEYYTTSGWARITYVRLPSGGCETIVIVPGYWVRFSVAHRGFAGYTGQAYMYNGAHYRFTGIAYF